jgi:choline dehydrogenase
MTSNGSTDYVVVGAGSAGCVIAARLSEDPGATVTLIEAGVGSDWRTSVPGLSGALWRTGLDWGFATAPQRAALDRTMHFPRGKVLGGTSCLNYMVYIRGHRDAYDAWRAEGNEGWGYDDLLPLFKKSERHWRGANQYHGGEGPLDVQSIRSPSRVTGLLAEAAAEVCRVPGNHDFNGPTQDGAGPFDVTIRDGRRCSTALAFLGPARSRPNLRVVTRAQATRVLFEGRRAVGVKVRIGRGEYTIHAEREVIVSAGAIGSPHLLMLSGIGPAEHLRAHGTQVVHDAPGVGQNLHDHFFGGAGYEALGGSAPTFTRLGALGWLLQYALTGRGPLTSNFCEAGAFVRVRSGAPRPDLQFHFVPTGIGREPNSDRVNYQPSGCGFVILPTLLYPKSVGEVRLRSADPVAAPLIDPRYLSEPDDVQLLLEGVRLANAIAHAAPMKGVTGKPLSPASEPGASDDVLQAELRLRGHHVFHPAGTCRMGKDDRAVVDAQLRVHGVENLRVADASIMPSSVGGNTNAGCILIGEKAALLIQSASEASGVRVAPDTTMKAGVLQSAQ